MRKHVSKSVSTFCHGAMLRGNTEFFCGVAKANFASWRQKFTLETMLPLWQNWETLGKHVRATNVSGNTFPRFARLKDYSGQVS